MIDSDRLAAFIAFAEELGFTSAARRLHISQPALHAKVQRLSEELGVSLYRRDGRRLVLTPAGRATLAHAREAQGLSDSFLATLRNGRDTSPIVLAAGEGAFLDLLGPALAEFRLRSP